MSEKYKPSEEEIKKAEEIMTDEQKEMSEERVLLEKELSQDLNRQLKQIISLGVNKEIGTSVKDYEKILEQVISIYKPDEEALKLGWNRFILVDSRVNIESLARLLESKSGRENFQYPLLNTKIKFIGERTYNPRRWNAESIESLQCPEKPYVLQLNLDYFRDLSFLQAKLAKENYKNNSGLHELQSLPLTPLSNMRCLSGSEGVYLAFLHPEYFEFPPDSDKNKFKNSHSRGDLSGPAYLLGHSRVIGDQISESVNFIKPFRHFEKNSEGIFENTENSLLFTGLHYGINGDIDKKTEGTIIPVAAEPKNT